MRTLGLDIGTKRTGVALSDEMGMFASPHSTVEQPGRKKWLQSVRQLVQDNEVGKIVIGLPLDQNGEEGLQAQLVRTFIALCQKRLSVPVIEWDERFSTAQAERSMIEANVSRAKRKQRIDKVAAAIILQSFLDTQHDSIRQ